MKTLTLSATLLLTTACVSAPPASDDQYETAFAAQKGAFSECYQQAGGKGDMRATFVYTLTSENRLKTVSVDPARSANVTPVVENCLLGAFRKVELPKGTANRSGGTYTFSVQDHRG